MKIIKFFTCKKAYRYYVKRPVFTFSNKKFFWKTAFYGLGTELDSEPEPEPEPEPESQIFKVGTGTVKNSYGSATLPTTSTSAETG
jgi:hypothetical protein